MLVNRSIDSDCYFRFGHSIEQDGRANRYEKGSSIRDQRCRVLNNFDVVFIVIDIKSVIEFVEDCDGAGVGTAVESVSEEERRADNQTRWNSDRCIIISSSQSLFQLSCDMHLEARSNDEHQIATYSSICETLSVPNFHGAGKSSFDAFVKRSPLSHSDFRTTRTTSPKYFPLMYFSNLQSRRFVWDDCRFVKRISDALLEAYGSFTMVISAFQSRYFYSW